MPFLSDSIPSNLFAAENIYNHNLASIWNIAEADPGHPTLYPFIIAVFWTVLGKSLWVTHLAVAITGFFLCALVFKIASRFLDESIAKFATLLFIISPLYVGQLFSASLQLPLVLFGLLAFLFWQQKKYLPYAAAMAFMVLCHLQGAFFLLFLCVNDGAQIWLQNGKKSILPWMAKRWWVYAIPFAAFIVWGILHKQQFGWAFTSPNYLREAPGIKGLFYNFGIAFWRIIDFGYIIPFAAVLFYFLSRKNNIYKSDNKTILAITYLLHLAVIIGGICIVFAHPPIHRYFLSASVFLLIVFAAVISNMNTLKGRIWAILAGIFLVAGNFLYYPGKCLGDANLAYSPIFELENNLVHDFPKGTEFYTYAPLSYPSSIRYLDSNKGPIFKGLYNTNMDSVAYIVQSTMNCEFSPAELEKLKGWYGTSYESGAVYINVYANPAKVQKPEGWQLRQPSGAEKWLKNLKEKLQ